jgi:hypothetical protein
MAISDGIFSLVAPPRRLPPAKSPSNLNELSRCIKLAFP